MGILYEHNKCDEAQSEVKVRKGIVWGSAVALLIVLPSGVAHALPPSAEPASAWVNRPITTPVTPDSPDFIGPRIEHRAVEPSRAQTRTPLAASRMSLARTRVGAISVAGELNAELYQWNFDQMGCLVDLWDHESNWNYRSINRVSGAHGIAQALPAWKMSTVAKDWRKNPVTQITWGMNYIKSRYGNPCNALRHWQQKNWY